MAEHNFFAVDLGATNGRTILGSIVDGKRAVEIGLIDRLGGLGEAVSELKRMIKEKK